MKKATIYTETTIKGPAVKDGAYCAAIEYILKNGKPYEKYYTGNEENTTYHRCALQAILLGLSRFKEKCEIDVVTEDVLIANLIQKNQPEKWERQEWKNSKKTQVKNKELWQQFLEELNKHKITVTLSKINPYREKMREEMGRVLKNQCKSVENIENTERRGE